DGDLARQVAARDGGGYFRDIADLRGEVRRQAVDVVGQVFPGTGDTRHVGLAAEAAFRADFACDARYFARERAQLIGRGVEGLLQLQQLAAHVDGDLLRQVAIGDRGRDLGDVTDLRSEVRCHEVDVVGQVFPCAGHFRHLCLAAELA